MVLSVLACGCMVGPNYKRPPVVQPDGFKSSATPLGTTRVPKGEARRDARIAPEWWRLYREPELDQLIATANDSNQTLKQAVAAVDQARALARVAGSFRYPTISLDPSFTRQRTSATRVSTITGQPVGTGATFNDWLVPVDLTYEIDVWGRVRRSLESATAQAVASADDEAMVRLTVQTDVAQYYYTLRSLDAQAEILAQTVDRVPRAGSPAVGAAQERAGQRRSCCIKPRPSSSRRWRSSATSSAPGPTRNTRSPFSAGSRRRRSRSPANPLRETVAARRAAGSAGGAAHAAAGRGRRGAAGRRRQCADRRRDGRLLPDLLARERGGIREREPQHPVRLAEPHRVNIIPGVSLPIFQGGRLKANLEATQAQYRQTVAVYVNQVLIAYGDVEDALTDLHALIDDGRPLSRGRRRLAELSPPRPDAIPDRPHRLPHRDRRRAHSPCQPTLARAGRQPAAGRQHSPDQSSRRRLGRPAVNTTAHHRRQHLINMRGDWIRLHHQNKCNHESTKIKRVTKKNS